MDICHYCGKPLNTGEPCSCWDSLMHNVQPEDANTNPSIKFPIEEHQAPQNPRPNPFSFPLLVEESKKVFKESFSVFRPLSSEDKPFIASQGTSFVLLALYAVAAGIFFFSSHAAIQRRLNQDFPLSGLLVVLALVLTAIHILCHLGLPALLSRPSTGKSSQQLLSIAAANASTWTLGLLLLSILIHLFSFSTSLMFFSLAVVAATSYLVSAYLFYQRMQPLFPEKHLRRTVVISCTAFQTGLSAIALLSLMLKIIDQLLSTIFG